MKKLFYFLLMLSVCLSIFSTLALGAEMKTNDTEKAYEESIPAPSEGEDSIDAPAEDQADATFLGALYEAYEENKSDLFSLASALVSLVLVFVYQRGLVPTLKGGLTLIEGQVKALREVSTDTKEENAKSADETRALALQMAQSAERMQEVLSDICARRAEEESEEQGMKRLEECLRTQTELLGELFLHSSLPEYEKERVAAMVGSVRTMLAPEESEA